MSRADEYVEHPCMLCGRPLYRHGNDSGYHDDVPYMGRSIQVARINTEANPPKIICPECCWEIADAAHQRRRG